MKLETIVEAHMFHSQAEIVHVPKIIQQERITQQHVAMVVEVPVQMQLIGSGPLDKH